MQKVYFVTNENEYKDISQSLAKNYESSAIFALTGGLGSGKTTFTRHLGKAYGTKSTIKSPTFTLHREHEIASKDGQKHYFNHIDLYRIEKKGEFDEIKITPMVKRENIVVIEWADKFKSEIMSMKKYAPIIWIHFEYVDENTRKLTIKEDKQ
ncbi:tRNA (adenosine(37)-N6)-threonylcarbamoyltransferase complex ATPase subunit type 1 TsaE [candidate division WWE3 bacterium RIFCSPLOWO2_01_FULL_39_13]|uniref:tRNA threonylcarbamoyladenosine biosynthesis protein TsaE n=1 Tax=candidate division WWE3 bacterium RIFCSPLOWO2_01_FULL_39_13 TaxID=1802624 RepID=A0A1F4V5T7_UNCKA|nr:MAG: tRNA (adenosine(37)-N6)-threonylcarbamoyltransferase complex ATPase subunit type 1 TsaE [candidate division WWE3 bacterium RIFCSPLOWO2_01_FULL_39_13]